MSRTFPEPATTDPLETFVRSAGWSRALTSEQLSVVLAHTEQRRCDSGHWVLRAGEVVEHWCGVVEGFAKMSVASADGKVSTLTGVCAGAWFGEGSLMKHEARRYDVYALRPLRLAMVPRAIFEWLRDTSIPFNHCLQDLLNARLAHFIGTLSDDRLLDTDARVARALAGLYDEDLYPGAGSHLDIDQREVGLLANVSRQRAHVALHRLQAQGVLSLARRGLTVLDLGALRRAAIAAP